MEPCHISWWQHRRLSCFLISMPAHDLLCWLQLSAGLKKSAKIKCIKVQQVFTKPCINMGQSGLRNPSSIGRWKVSYIQQVILQSNAYDSQRIGLDKPQLRMADIL